MGSDAERVIRSRSGAGRRGSLFSHHALHLGLSPCHIVTMSPCQSPLAVLVDNNLLFTAQIEASLRRFGFEVRTLPPGAAVASQIAALAPKLVLINLGSNREIALETLRRLRATPELGDTRLIGF